MRCRACARRPSLRSDQWARFCAPPASPLPSAPPQRTDLTRLVCVSPRFFETMGIPILAGRGITGEDRAGSPPTVVLSETTARAVFGAENPIGRSIANGDHYEAKSALQVVGVA